MPRFVLRKAFLTGCLLVPVSAGAQTPRVFTHADTLRGSNGPAARGGTRSSTISTCG